MPRSLKPILEQIGQRIVRGAAEVLVDAGEAAADVVLENIEEGLEHAKGSVAQARERAGSRRKGGGRR